MKHCKSVLLLCCLCLTVFAGCGKSESDSNYYAEDPAPDAGTSQADDSSSEEAAATEKTTKPPIETPVSRTKADGTSDIHVTVQSVEVSLDDLKAQDYVVPVYVSLDENSGIFYSEWGVSYDERCSVDAESFGHDIYFQTTYSINENAHFLWTAWSTSETRTDDGNLLLLLVTLPEDAAPGDSYPIQYAPVSQANMLHSWASPETDWVKEGYISWTDGGITVTE